MARKPETARPTVNETLRDKGIAHAIALERLKASSAKAIVTFIDDELLPELIAKLDARLGDIEARGLDIGPAATQRLSEMIQSLRGSVNAWATGAAAKIIDQLTETASFEVRWAATGLSEALVAVPITVDLTLPTALQLRTLIESRPIDGVLVKSMVQKMSAGIQSAIDQNIRLGIAAGETTPQIKRRVKRVGVTAKGSAEAIVRTATGHAASIGRDAAYDTNADIIKGIQLVETLDTRTCPRCMALDGKVFAIGKGPRAPHHINCRGTSIPVLKNWQTLGIKASEMDISTRASMDGQVAANLNYPQWLKRQSAKVQDEALGPARGKLFRSGGIEVNEFVSRSGDLLNLDDLKTMHLEAFTRAGL